MSGILASFSCYGSNSNSKTIWFGELCYVYEYDDKSHFKDDLQSLPKTEESEEFES